MSHADFFQRLRPFRNFLDFAAPKHYADAPSDWQLLITDVVNSTEAIRSGRYKSVNMVGAASIAAVVNALGTQEIPFSFGGDGATALLPPASLEPAKQALRTVEAQAREAFGLQLRVGLVPVGALQEAGAPLAVSRFGLPGGPCVAFFRGAGLDLAERWVKSGRYALEAGEALPTEQVMAGLSCRWAPLENTRGMMLSILVKSRKAGPEGGTILSEVLKALDGILQVTSAAAHPVKPESFRAEGLTRASRLEAHLARKRGRWAARLQIIAEMLAVKVLRACNLSAQGIRFRDYLRDNPAHSDYCKFDETLRLVIDCTPQMKAEAEAFLERERRAGRIYYGLSSSGSALLTCFVKSLRPGQHLHFVDGNDGGYALAARQLKEQIALRQ